MFQPQTSSSDHNQRREKYSPRHPSRQSQNEYTIEISQAKEGSGAGQRQEAQGADADASGILLPAAVRFCPHNTFVDDTARKSLNVPRLAQAQQNNTVKDRNLDKTSLGGDSNKQPEDLSARCSSPDAECCLLQDLQCSLCRKKGGLRFLASDWDEFDLSDRNRTKQSRLHEHAAAEMRDQEVQTAREVRSGAESGDEDRKQWQHILRNLFISLARSGGKHAGALSSLRLWKSVTMRKDTFLQIFPQLPGVVGERLFAAFDLNKNGVVDFREFCSGLSVLFSAELYQKLEFVFHMYDLNGDGMLSRDELSMMLYYIPASIGFLSNKTMEYSNTKSHLQDHLIYIKHQNMDGDSCTNQTDPTPPDSQINIPAALLKVLKNSDCEESTTGSVNAVEQLVDRLVNQAFEIFNTREHSNGDRQTNRNDATSVVEEMDFSTFCEAVIKFPDLRIALEVFCDETIQPYSFLPIPPEILNDNLSGASSSRKLTPLASRSFSQKVTDRFGMKNGEFGQPLIADSKDRQKRVQCDYCGGISLAELAPHMEDAADLATIPLKLGLTKDCYSTDYRAATGTDMTGWLEKVGRLTGRRIRRFFVLRDRFLYYYRYDSDKAPMKVIVMTGARVERTWDDASQFRERYIEEVLGGDESGEDDDDAHNERNDRRRKLQASYGMTIKLADGQSTLLYTKTKRERDRWMKKLIAASGGVNSFHDLYSLKEPLGRGRFATVFTAVQKSNNERVAVKILKRPMVGFHNKQRHRLRRGRRMFSFQWLLGSKIDDDKTENEPDEILREFQRNEIAVLRLLYHPNLIKLNDVLSTREFLYIVMEWHPSGDIQRVLDTLMEVNAKLRAAAALELEPGQLREMWIPEWIVRQTVQGILQGLTFLHSPRRNIIHRDLKPENILLKINCGQIQSGMSQCVRGLPNLAPTVITDRDRKGLKSRLGKSVTMEMESRRSHQIPYYNVLSPRLSDSQFKIAEMRSSQHGDNVINVQGFAGEDSDSPPADKSVPSKTTDPNRTDIIRGCGGRLVTNTQSNTRQGDADCNFDSSSIDTIDLYSVKDHISAFSDLEVDRQLGYAPQTEDTGLLQPLPSAIADHFPARINSVSSESCDLGPAVRPGGKINRVAIETLNFWVFVHCLDVCQAKVEDRTCLKLRHDRRAATFPAQLVSKVDESVCSNVVKIFVEGDTRRWLETLSTDTTEMAMNGLFSSSLVKECAMPKITDFGLSKIIAPPARAENYPSKKNLDPASIVDMTSYAKEALGTAAYAAPEVLQGLRYTTSADMWSLGVIIYQLFSGGHFPIFMFNEQPGDDGGSCVRVKEVASMSRSLVDIVESLDLNWKKWVLIFEPQTAWTRVSSAAKDFVSLLLTVDPQMRMSARAALEHNWICDESVFPDYCE